MSDPIRRRVRGPLSRPLASVLLMLALLFAGAAQAEGIELLKSYLRGLNSLSAEFRQITMSADGSQTIESRGTFYLLRPNRFRWDYRTPSEQQIIADGRRIYVHDKELEQVTHRSQRAVLDGTPAQLLASEQPVEEYFRLSNLDRDDGRTWVELIPRASDSEVARLQIGFAGGELQELLMEDRFGQLTRFSFSDLQRNPQLDFAMFRFQRPARGDFLQID
ncbi:MAG: outer membrane lipoprotein carrier protein LolA [Chromatiaceae bacterium]|nr:MAG: outer membrane lipoprotein carrier protein LolA [Chromatiaceae bacterium]